MENYSIWNNVKDKLPEEGFKVLAFGDGCYFLAEVDKDGLWKEGAHDYIDKGLITKWHYLDFIN